MSPLSARAAESLGYKNVKVFHDGLPVWKKGKNLLVSEPGYLMSMIRDDIAHVLIDLRPARIAKKSHIRGAASIPSDKLSEAKGMFPSKKSAPIILYTEKGIDLQAFKTVRGWGYKNASVLNGGLAGLKAAGGKPVSGMLAKKITYEPKPLPGTVQAGEFEKIAMSTPKNKLILDVRDNDEVAQGIIKGAKHIPVGEMAERMEELPKNKEILIHCTTGIRAMMAFNVLNKNGYKSRYLNNVIQVDQNGKFEITSD